ncbi:MAG: HDOD domain-containing protein [Deltaproteobacteria bacterium]|nr:HDOD domain-containing protein [Deltaproteobacteria bacterium]
MAEDRGLEIQSFVKGMYRTRTIPTMLGKILALVKDENSSPQDLIQLISHDQALAERTIRIANSVMFGHSGTVRDLRHAVMFLGYERIRSIALAMGVMDAFPARNSLDIQNLWIHGYEVAYLSAVISDTISMVAPAESFLCGLIHDIGRLIFFEKDREKYYEIGTGDDFLDREMELFGCTHADAGGWYAVNAGIPDDIVSAIRSHHHPSEAGENHLGVSILSLAEGLSRRFCPRFIDDGVWIPAHGAILLELDIGDDAMQSICHKLGGLRYDIKAFFGGE